MQEEESPTRLLTRPRRAWVKVKSGIKQLFTFALVVFHFYSCCCYLVAVIKGLRWRLEIGFITTHQNSTRIGDSESGSLSRIEDCLCLQFHTSEHQTLDPTLKITQRTKAQGLAEPSWVLFRIFLRFLSI